MTPDVDDPQSAEHGPSFFDWGTGIHCDRKLRQLRYKDPLENRWVEK